jgi:hypothetical protein
MSGSRHAFIVLTALCVLATKIAIAYNTYGTNDAITFEADIAKLESAGPETLYREGVEPAPGDKQSFSHSPPVIHGLLLLKGLENQSGLPVRFWLRVCCALADLASLGLLWKIGVRSRAALLLTALSPVSLMISGFHVNTDPLIACAVLLSVCLIRSQRFAWAGAALGVALSVKLTAVVFVPALAIAVGAKKSAVIVGIAVLCFCGLSLPYIWEFPKTIATSILTYAGLSRLWGISGLSLLTGADGFFQWYGHIGKFVALALVGMVAVVVGNRGRRQDVLSNCGLLASIFLIFTPGFGIQYLVYLVPWLAVARRSVAVGFYAVSGTFMAALYTWGSRGFPWYLANFYSSQSMPRSMSPYVFLLGLLTWIAVGVVACDFARISMRNESGRGGDALPRAWIGRNPWRIEIRFHKPDAAVWEIP